MKKPDILLIATVPPFLVEQLAQHYTLHRLQHPSLPFPRQPSPQHASTLNQQVIPLIRAIVANGESIVDAAFMRCFPALACLASFGVGYDGIDVKAANALGIAVTNTPDVLTDDVADFAMALMLNSARNVAAADRFVRAGGWLHGAYPLGRRVSGARLGIVGLGRIGNAVAQRATGFGMSIAYHARAPRNDVPYLYYPALLELAAAVDFLLVCTVGGAATRALINADVLKALGPDGILVNISRGTVVDERALVVALQEGVIGGAGLDVFTHEPVVPRQLLNMENVVLTPHMASGTLQTRTAMSQLVLDNLDAHFCRRPLPSQVCE